MWWWIIGVIFILGFAWAFRKATKNTPFANDLGCTPNIDKLKELERGEGDTGQGKEQGHSVLGKAMIESRWGNTYAVIMGMSL